MLLAVSKELEEVGEFILRKLYHKEYIKASFIGNEELSIFYDSLYTHGGEEDDEEEGFIEVRSKYFDLDGGVIIKVGDGLLVARKGLNPSFNIFYFVGDKLVISDSFKVIWVLMKEIEENTTLSNFMEVFYLRHLPVDKTLIREIERLPPISQVKFKKRNKKWIISSRTEFEVFANRKPSSISNPVVIFEESMERFLGKLFQIEEMEEIPILLSGGIDSTLLLAIAKSYVERHKVGKRLVTYTFPLKADKNYAKLVCEQMGVENRTISWSEDSHFLIHQFKDFVLTHGYPIFHPGFFQLAFKEVDNELIFWNQGIEDVTLGREELRIIHNLERLDFLHPFVDVISNRSGLSVIRDFIKEKDEVMLFLSLRSLIPLGHSSCQQELVFKAREIKALEVSLSKKIGLFSLLNGFCSDPLNLGKILISPVISSHFLRMSIFIPDELLVRGRYDRFIERILLARFKAPKEIYLKRERDTWEKQAASWFLKMQEYHYKNINFLREVGVFPKKIEENLISRLDSQKNVYFLSSFAELLRSFFENSSFKLHLQR